MLVHGAPPRAPRPPPPLPPPPPLRRPAAAAAAEAAGALLLRRAAALAGHGASLRYARHLLDEIPAQAPPPSTPSSAPSPPPRPVPLPPPLPPPPPPLPLPPDRFTFPPPQVLRRLSDPLPGLQLHAFMLKSAADRHLFSSNALIHMYASCALPALARRAFALAPSPARDAVSWNCLLSGYLANGLLARARSLFDRMPRRRRGPVAWNAMISGHAKLGLVRAARALFDEMPHRNVESWNAMIAGYARCGRVDLARELFHAMPARNAVSWSAMITACARGDRPAGALALFAEMEELGITPNWAAIVSVLSACSQIGALDRGKRVHSYIVGNKMRMDSIIGTALIDMYAKCGCIDRAFETFLALPGKDVFSWTAMIGGFAVNGRGAKALELFRRMEEEGIRPNEVTFVGVLCACSHGGFVDLAKKYFNSMSEVYGLEPQIEHYGCMVDALGRAGLLEEAAALVRALPPNPVLWGSLLGACWIHGNAEVGECAVDRLIELKPDDAGVYVLLSNIYAMRGRWDDARKTRLRMKAKGLDKSPGRSSIEVRGVVHEFLVGDRSHPRNVEIHRMLDEMSSKLKLEGYQPNTTSVLFDIEEEEKQNAVAHHSEKLAIAFGLISTDRGEPIRVFKNLRVCRDCHTAAKLVSKVYEREIILRDRNIFHYFAKGSCSCRDYW
ncbi:Pentatricopeptide repeat-containing protein [Ananas comosus]|uniref:Pentatricopeptide repeat-containing protein n=1 Tax=Ananas comosus TaxID=4615 RepID=A0A199UWD0_ANACO|nr:Pentatricopeptide repeat-containing protein [Ananas comosus]